MDKIRHIHLSIEINERLEGNRLFLTNHKYRTFMMLSGDNIIKYKNLKQDIIGVAKELEEKDSKLFYALYRCRIIEGDVDQEKEKAERKAALRRLIGHDSSIGSPFSPFRILWEITRRCNRKCLYCHSPASEIESKGDIVYDLSLENLYIIADKLAEARVMEVTLSGGECLLRGEELFQLIKKLRCHKMATSIISNGLLVTDMCAKKIKEYEVSVGISIDSYNEEKQSITRGKGTFDHAVKAIKILLENKIKMNAICTLTRFNFDDLDNYISFLKNLGVKTIVIQNLIPGMDLNNYHSIKLTNNQEDQLSSLIPYLLTKYRDIFIQTTEVGFFAQLEYVDSSFEEGEYVPFSDNMLMSRSCSACHTGGFVDYLGNLYPCTSLRMIPMGNLVEFDLVSLWMFSENAKFTRELRRKTTDNLLGCNNCNFVKRCSGGCRGEAYTLSGDWYALHDRCPVQRAKSKII